MVEHLATHLLIKLSAVRKSYSALLSAPKYEETQSTQRKLHLFNVGTVIRGL